MNRTSKFREPSNYSMLLKRTLETRSYLKKMSTIEVVPKAKNYQPLQASVHIKGLLGLLGLK